MDYLRREDLEEKQMLGRMTCAAFGKEGIARVTADDAFFGFATFAPKYGKMKPHYHENEIMYVLDAVGASVRYGAAQQTMNTRLALKKGDIIRAREGEWHVFEFDSEDSFLDIIAIFSVPLCHTVESEEQEG